MKSLVITISAILAFTTVFGQGLVRLVIQRHESRFPATGVTVSAVPGNQSTVSDDLGLATLKITASDTIINFSGIGFVTNSVRIADINDSTIVYMYHRPVELKEVTVSANPADQYAPISKIDIALRGLNNSQEILRMVPGLFIGQHAGGGKAEQIFLRGFDLDHGTDINLSVDGIPVNMVSHAHGQGYADLHFLIPETIQQVAFKKGTYYADKGNLATSGYVNFKTMTVLTRNTLKVEGGMFGTFRSMGMFNLLKNTNRQKQQSAYVAAEYMHTDGYFDRGQNFNRVNLFAKYNGKLSNASTLTISASGFSSKWDASGQIPDRAVKSGVVGFFGSLDPNEGGNTDRTNVNATINTTLPRDMSMKNQVFFSRYNFLLYSNFTFFLKDSINGDQIRQKEARALFGYNGSIDKVSYLGDTKLISVLGLNSRTDIINGSELSHTRNRNELITAITYGDIAETNLGVYTEQTFHFRNRIALNAGIRFDQFFNRYVDRLADNKRSTATASILSPKINLYYNLSKHTQFYASAGRGFHSNDTRVVVPRDGLKVLPAAYGADLGTILKPFNNLLLNIAAWYMWMEQEFVYVGDEGITEPGGRTQRIGLDLSARYQPTSWLFMDFDLNYSHARDMEQAKGNNFLPLSPKVTSIGGVTIKTSRHVNSSIRYRYMSDRPANADNSIMAKGYFITDALINYSSSNFELFISAQNIFNTKWKETQFDTESRLKNEPKSVSEIHFTPGTPFSVKAGFSYSF